MIDDLLVFLFVVSQCPCLKKGIIIELKEWSTWSLSKILTSSFLLNLHFFTFLGLERSTKVWKNLEVVKKSKCFFLFVFFFFLLLLLLFFFFFVFIYIFCPFRNDN